MTVSTLRELLVHDLEDAYYAEQELLDALDELAGMVDDFDYDRVTESPSAD